MTALLLAGLLHGAVTYYADGVFEQVYANRLALGHVQPCPACSGFVAVQDCRLLGRHATLQRPGHAPEGLFLVADCGPFQTHGRIAEVDRQTARRWRMTGPLAGVTLRLVPHDEPERETPRQAPRGGREAL